jgi:hypothetical protein
VGLESRNHCVGLVDQVAGDVDAAGILSSEGPRDSAPEMPGIRWQEPQPWRSMAFWHVLDV